MWHSKFFAYTSTLKILYFALVRSHIDFADVIWHSMTGQQIEMLERVQKRFLKFLYYKDFSYYNSTITYGELVLGYETTTLRVRRDLALVMMLRNLLCARLDSPSLLEGINLYAPVRRYRTQTLFQTSRCRTLCYESPLNRAMTLCNEIININFDIDVFFGGKKEFKEKTIQALIQLHNGGG